MTDIKTDRTTWKLSEWNEAYGDHTLPKLTAEDIAAAIRYLRQNGYPVPEDCPGTKCPKWRTACNGVDGMCGIAVGMCVVRL